MSARRATTATAAAGLAAVLAVSACTGGSKSAGHGSVTTSPSSSAAATPSASASAGARSTEARFFLPKQARDVLTAAQNAVQVVNSYDYRRVPAALAAGTPLTTGSFRKQFRLSLQKNAAALGKAHKSQQATVTVLGLGPLVKGTATVLAVGRLKTTTKAAPAGTVAPFGVVARFTRVSGKWLLSGASTDKLVVNGAPPGTPGLVAATKAAQVAVRTVLTLRSASFTADHAKALAITAGKLRAQLRAGTAAARKSVAGGVDLGVTVPAVVAVRAGGKRAVFLVHAEPFTVTKGKRTAAAPRNLQVTMATVRGRWAAVDLTSVG